MDREKLEKLVEALDSGPFDYERAANYLGMKKGTLQNKVSTKKITCYRPDGGHVYFLRKDLDAYALRNPQLADFEANEKMATEVNRARR